MIEIMKRIKLIIGGLLFLNIATAQVAAKDFIQQLDRMDTTSQHCFDEGLNFVDCSNTLYKQVDSILNVVYKLMKSKMDAATFIQLKEEQLNWLKKRDQFFKEVNQDYKQRDKYFQEDEESNRAVAISRKAEYVEKRIKYILQKWYPKLNH
jgi:uncharacterized protein YecT (DUF1311 family)